MCMAWNQVSLCNGNYVKNRVPLTHWGWVTHICIGNLNTITSDNGLSPGQHQAIIWNNAGISIGYLGTKFSEILIEFLTFSFKKMRLKVSSVKWWPFCLGRNVLRQSVVSWILPIDTPLLACLGEIWVVFGFNWQSLPNCCQETLHEGEIWDLFSEFNVWLFSIVIAVLHIMCLNTGWCFDSLWPSDTIWWHISGSTLAQVMACYLTAPSDYLNQCWHDTREVLCHSAISQEMLKII